MNRDNPIFWHIIHKNTFIKQKEIAFFFLHKTFTLYTHIVDIFFFEKKKLKKFFTLNMYGDGSTIGRIITIMVPMKRMMMMIMRIDMHMPMPVVFQPLVIGHVW